MVLADFDKIPSETRWIPNSNLSAMWAPTGSLPGVLQLTHLFQSLPDWLLANTGYLTPV